MVKRETQYRTRGDRPIYSENGQFYFTRNNGVTWRRLPDTSRYFSLVWDPLDPNNNIAYANLLNEGSIANLKARYNRAARTIQRVERGRASRKRTVLRRTIFGQLPNNLLRNIFRR
jgi:hypothetical protein